MPFSVFCSSIHPLSIFVRLFLFYLVLFILSHLTSFDISPYLPRFLSLLNFFRGRILSTLLLITSLSPLFFFLRKYILFLVYPTLIDGSSSTLIRSGLLPFSTSTSASSPQFTNGGLLLAFQFFAGPPVSNVFDFCQSSLFPSSAGKETLYCFFRSSFVLLGMLCLSTMSLYALYRFLRSHISDNYKWLFAPLLFTFLFLSCHFQQSFSVHGFGYSYLWSFLFSFFVYYFIFQFVRRMNYLLLPLLFMLPFPIFVHVLSSSRISISAIYLN